MANHIDKLPETCFVVDKANGEVALLRRGERGRYVSTIFHGNAEEQEELVNYMNEKLGVTKAQREAMYAGSMFGFNSPAADPDNYDAEGRFLPDIIPPAEHQGSGSMSLSQKVALAQSCGYCHQMRCSLNGYPPFDCATCSSYKKTERSNT
jgi:hypothetical protein